MNENDNLKISREGLQEVADFLPYPFIIAEDFGDRHLNTHLNEKFLEEIGYTLEEIPTIDAWYILAYPDEAYRKIVIQNWDLEEIESQQKGKVFVKMKSQVTRKNGSKRWYEIKATVINKIHVVAFVDLDKEITLQEELKKINKNNDRMLSILGHDLRSPIANLMGISSMAANAEISNAEFVALMDTINKQSIQVLELLDRTLNWAKLNFDTIQQKNVAIALKDILVSICDIYKTSYESKKIVFHLTGESHDAIHSDIEIVTIIIRNIISNAIKFTPQNGKIEIHFYEKELIIRDNGIGMTTEMIADILSSSYTSRRGTNNEIGLGMGLQLVKNLCEKINSKLLIESKPNVGTTIRILF